MNDQFIHSVKVPTQYKKAAKILKLSLEQGASLKSGIFNEKHARTNRLYALIVKISKNKELLDRLIDRSEILKNESKLDKYLCLVLITELLFGAKKLNGDSKPVECIRSYETKFNEILNEINTTSNNNNNNQNQSSSAIANNDNEQADDGHLNKPRYVRVNTNLMKRAEAIDAFANDGWRNLYENHKFDSYTEYLDAVKNLGDYDFLSDLHVNNLFVFPSTSKRYWAGHQLVAESKLILQDKASCLPSMFLNPPKKSNVLDMCAAPGMKTTHLCAIMKDKGHVYAVEQNQRRYQTLLDVVNYTKSTCVIPINGDCLALGPDDLPNIEYILIDPPCSGSGMSNRLSIAPGKSEQYADRSTDRISKLAGLQIKMLTHALQSFPNARKVIYSTCSIYPEENEEVIQRCLHLSSEQYGWELVKPQDFADLWKNFGSPKYKHIGKKCIYAKTNEDFTDGFFLAIFERKNLIPNDVEHKNGNLLMIDDEKPVMDEKKQDEFIYQKNIDYDQSNGYEENELLANKGNNTIDDQKLDTSMNNDEVVIVEDEKLSKKHKKKKKSKDKEQLDVDSIQLDVQVEGIDENIEIVKHKKKKRKRDNEKAMENHEIIINEQETNENVKKKKKTSK